jgi:ribosome-binding protein aMBF1 (putative translation factor)
MQSVKRCEQCGRVIAYEESSDYYSFIRLKYCRPCAADVHRRQIAESMRRARAAARERRELEKQITQQTTTENELLREIVRQQAARIADLETYLKKKS